MIACKFLRPGAVGPFSGRRWPAPAGGEPGAWVDGAGRGVHACRRGDLPLWIGEELWVVELSGPVRAATAKVVAPRGRLLARVPGWDEDAARGFAAACVRRTFALAAATGDRDVEAYAAEAEAWRDAPGPDRARAAAVAGFVAAEAAGRVDGPDGASAERARQVAWFERLLRGAPVPSPP